MLKNGKKQLKISKTVEMAKNRQKCQKNQKIS